MITFVEKETEPVYSSFYRQIKPDCHLLYCSSHATVLQYLLVLK